MSGVRFKSVFWKLSWEFIPERFCPKAGGGSGWRGWSSAAAAAKSLQLCPTLCDPPGSPVPGILQARTLEWVVLSFSNA